MANDRVKRPTDEAISSELEKIASVLHSQGFETVFGYGEEGYLR